MIAHGDQSVGVETGLTGFFWMNRIFGRLLLKSEALIRKVGGEGFRNRFERKVAPKRQKICTNARLPRAHPTSH